MQSFNSKAGSVCSEKIRARIAEGSAFYCVSLHISKLRILKKIKIYKTVPKRAAMYGSEPM
jgi:hypothetical protein